MIQQGSGPGIVETNMKASGKTVKRMAKVRKSYFMIYRFYIVDWFFR